MNTFTVEKDWTTKAGLRAVVTLNRHRCGYVAVPRGHVLHGVEYGDNVPLLQNYANNASIGAKSPIFVITAGLNATEGERIRASPDIVLECHGGLTYSGDGDYPVPSDGLWWFGFDCAHYNDAPVVRGPYDTDDYLFGKTVRSLDFCVAQCESLARQIDEICSKIP